MAGFLARPGAIFLPILPLAAVELALGSEVGLGAWNRYSYAILLVYGYLAAADARIGEAFQRHWRLAASLALLGFVAAGAVYAVAQAGGDPLTGNDRLSLPFSRGRGGAGVMPVDGSGFTYRGGRLTLCGSGTDIGWCADE
jgi:hypothetical protein